MAKRNRKSKNIINYLPEDVLREIFSHLHRFDILKSTSLVCKLFCSLSSPLVHELTVKDSSLTCSDLHRLFKRFTQVKKIRIKFPKLDNALLAICNFDLINLEKLEFSPPHIQYPELQTLEIMSTSRVIKSIKSLKLSWCGGQTIWMVIEFINMFPSLTELNITEYGLLKDILIEKVTSNLPNLRKISFSHYNLLSDKTLDILSSNCPKLESINFRSCQRFTPKALYKFFCNNPQLSSLHMRDLPSVSKLVKFKCMQVLQNINHLSLKTDVVRDALLIALADSRPPLKSLSLVIYRASSRKYTMSGLSRLLSTCPDLISLKVQLPYVENSNTTQDAEMSIVVKRLPNLKHISIWSRVVCQATLFSLVQNCPLLETIRLLSCSKCSRSKQVCDQEEGIPRPTKKNYSIKFITVNPESDTWLLSTVEPYCPNLRKSKHFMD